MNLIEHVLRFARTPLPAGKRMNFLDTARIQLRVISALMVRGALMRFGHENLGFFWIMGEPLLMSSGVMIMWSVAGMDHGHGVGIVPFALTGYAMMTLWRHVVGHMGHAIAGNAGLLFHRNVRMLDVLIANVVLESLGGFAAFVVAYIPLYLLGAVPPIDDPLVLVGGWVFITWISFSFGLVVAAISQISEGAARFIPAIMYITIPATGTFYMLSWLPEKAQKILIWSPLVHPFEMFRGGLFGSIVHAKFSATYMVVVCTVLTALGLALVRVAQKRIEV